MDDIAYLADRVAQLERTVQFLLNKLQLDYHDDHSGQFLDVALLKREGKTIQAIQAYREKTGASLSEAKLFVDKL
jgi:ribosomal protein L7/L12